MAEALRIDAVIRFPNGMVMVFDQHGEQMPDYQGVWTEMREKISRDKPPYVHPQHREFSRG